MFLNIPKLKTELVVKTDIIVPIYTEHRNLKFLLDYTALKQYGFNKSHWWIGYCDNGCKVLSSHRCKKCGDYSNNQAQFSYTILSGDVLIIDRYYIRNGSEDFDSVTFRFRSADKKTKGRFWLKLDDASQIEFV